MPKNRDALVRQWATLRLIPRYPRRISSGDVCRALMANGYLVTLRTVQRDLQSLSVTFPLSCDEATGPVGAMWYWPRGAEPLDIPGMEPAEALALVMSREQLAQTLPAATIQLLQPQFDKADSVLAAQSANRLAGWRKRVRVVPRGPRLAVPKVNSEIQRIIYDAVLLGRQIEARYRGRGAAQARKIRLHPYGLVVRDGLVYLVAAAWSYPQPHHYLLHRFRAAELLQDEANVPKHFDLDSYLDEEQAFGYPHSSDKLRLVLEVESEVAEHLSERPLAADQCIVASADVRARVEATVSDTAELRWWLLGFGSAVEVLEPDSLRSDLARSTADAAHLYKRAKR